MKQALVSSTWIFGMMAQIGVVAASVLVRSEMGTSANGNDLNEAGQLPHGQQPTAFGDARYLGVHQRPKARGLI